MSSAKKSNPSLWKSIVARVKSGSKGGDAGEWSARKAQLAVSLYKKAGGGYSGAKEATSLSKWTKQNWRTKSGKPSSQTGERYLPEKAIKVPIILQSTQQRLVPSVREQQRANNS
jgi:hypothetical protein